MNEFTLYTFNGDALFNIELEESSTHEWILMSENRLSLTFELEQCVNLSPGCYVDFDGVRYYLFEEYKPQMVDTTAWKYNVSLLDAASWMSVTLALNLLDGQNTPIFNYTAPAVEHARIIVENLNRRMGTTAWKVGSVISTANIAIEYRGKYCSEVLQEIVDSQNTEWWVEDMTLNIGRAEFGDAVELGYQNGLLGDIVCEQADNMRTYAYLYPIGSTRNIDPTKYGYERLQLPNGQTRVAMNTEQGVAELVEEKAFSKIFPRYEGTVQSVRSRPAKGDDGREFTIYYIGDQLPFNPNDYEIAGLVKQITFLSGQLMGQDFEVNYDPEAQEFEIITQWPDGGDAQLPGGLLTPELGDKYVIWNITMPDIYYTLASQEFLEAAEAFAAQAIQDVSTYKAPLDYIEVQERGLRLRPGQRVRLLSNAYFPQGYYDSRITRITRNVLMPDAPNIDVSAVRATGTISRLQTTIQKTEAEVAKISGALPTVIKSGEDTSASDSSIYTSAKSEREFLNKRRGGVVLGPVDFEVAPRFPTGAEFNGAMMRFDAEKKAWILPYNLVVEGGVAWHSSIDGFKPQTITDAVNVDGVTIGRTSSGALTVLAGAGGGIDEAQLADYLTTNNYAKKSDIPSLVGYATQSWVAAQLGSYALSSTVSALSAKVDDFLTGSDTDTIINKWKELEAFLSGLSESDNLATILGTKANKATTLAGYGITDAYTQVAANAKFIDFTSAQSVSGLKDFANGLKIGGALITYDSTKNAFVLPANLVVEGGVAWNASLDGFTPQTITDAVNVDGVTIGRTSSGALCVIGGASGGVADSVAWANITGKPTWIEATKPSYTYSEITGTPTALKNPYALSWSGYSSGSYDGSGVASIIIPSNTNQLTNGAGYITGITSSMVASALGYTPYNAANFTKANIKTTLGISDWALAASKPSYAYTEISGTPSSLPASDVYAWAKAASKPTYTASEVGALATSGGSLNGQLTVSDSGVSIIAHRTQALAALIRYTNTGGVLGSIGVNVDKMPIFMDTSGNIKTLAFTSDIPTKLSQLTDDVVAGVYLPLKGGTLIGALNMNAYFQLGNNKPITVADTDGVYQAALYLSTANNLIIGYGTSVAGKRKTVLLGNRIEFRSAGTEDNTLILAADKTATFVSSVTAPSFIGTLTGNAATATKLSTSRTIWGQSFDGTGNITGSIYGDIWRIVKDSTFDGTFIQSTNYEGTSDIGNIYITAKNGNNLNVFQVWALESTFRGNIVARGTVAWNSSRVLKNIVGGAPTYLTLAELRKIRPYRYTWKDGRDNLVHAGGIADEVKEVLPEVIMTDSNGIHSMDYGQAAFTVASSLTPYVSRHDCEIRELKREVRRLKNRIQQLTAN